MSDSDLTIRNEEKNDYRAVEQLVRKAFWNLYVPGCNEHHILHNLRASKDFIPGLDFITEQGRRIVGQTAYTRGIIEGKQGGGREVITLCRSGTIAAVFTSSTAS